MKNFQQSACKKATLKKNQLMHVGVVLGLVMLIVGVVIQLAERADSLGMHGRRSGLGLKSAGKNPWQLFDL